MTLDEETLRLGDERDRLDARLDELAGAAAEAEGDTVATYRRIANEVETRLSGVAYLCEQHGPEATVTVCGLTAGQFARVEDRVAAKQADVNQDSLPGYRDNVIAASGLVDAPFLEDDDAFETTLGELADQPVGVAKYFVAVVNDRTTVSAEDFRSFNARYAAKRED